MKVLTDIFSKLSFVSPKSSKTAAEQFDRHISMIKIRRNNEIMILERYCLFLKLFLPKNIAQMDCQKTVSCKLTYCLLSVYYFIFPNFFQRLHKSIGFQLCIHEGHGLKIQKLEGLTKDSKLTFCLLSV